MDPLTQMNSHSHIKNHPAGLAETQRLIKQLQAQNQLTSFYPTPLYIDTVAKKLNFDINSLSAELWQSIHNYQYADYNQMLQMCSSENIKIIFVSINNKVQVYNHTTRFLERMPFADKPAKSIKEIHSQRDQILYSNNADAWKDVDIWDVRERQALHKDLISWQQGSVDFNFEHYWVDSRNLWYNGDQEIPKIISWLGLEVNKDRFDSWLPIYRKWQQMQIQTLQFEFNYQHIVDSIVNNWSYDIDLTFEQEVIIQHCLIYQHNLNLKTWQLKKFPNNTKDLHKLLEPNIHPL